MTRIYTLETPKPNCWVLHVNFYTASSFFGSIEICFTLTDIHLCEYSSRFIGETLIPSVLVQEFSNAFNKVFLIRSGKSIESINKDEIYSIFDTQTDF